MTGICGWLGAMVGADSQTALSKMAGALTLSKQPDTGSVTDLSAIYAVGIGHDVAICDKQVTHAAIVGQPQWHNSELNDYATAHGQAAALIKAYQRYGSECLQQLEGFFLLAVLEPASRSALLAIDRMGTYPLAYTLTTSGELIFGSSLDAIQQHPCVVTNINPQALYAYTYFHAIPSPLTIYDNIRKLEPAQYIQLKDGRIKEKRYWLPDFQSSPGDSMKTLSEELRDTLRTVVSQYDACGITGTFLSGGIDSSTVSGVLAELNPESVPAYSIGFSAEGYDEMFYARIAAKQYGLEHYEYYVTPEDVADALPMVANAYDEPFGNSSAIPSYFCARLAKENGTQVMLAGDGGDELFAGNSRYAEQKLFAIYGQLPAWIRHKILEPTFLNSQLIRKFYPTRKIARYIEHSLVKMPDRMQNYNFLHMFSPASIFEPEFLDSIDINGPLEMLRNIYDEAPTESMLNRMLYMDWKFTLADNDLRKVNKMCELAGIRVCYPLIDDRMVSLSTKVPPKLKLKGLQLRYFFKQAQKNFLPDSILKKSKQGFGLPFGEWLKTSPVLQDTVYDSLNDLSNRKIYRKQFINELIDKHRKGHAAYYGTMVWVLSMLEQWFYQHKK